MEQFFDQFLGVIEKRDFCFHRISFEEIGLLCNEGFDRNNR